MTSALINRAQRTAKRLIKKNGRKLKFIRKNNGKYDPIEGEFTGAPDLEQELYTVVLPPKDAQKYESLLKDENGVLDLSKVQFLLISVEGVQFEPESLDLVEINGEKWKLVGLTPLHPDATIQVLYKSFIRRA